MESAHDKKKRVEREHGRMKTALEAIESYVAECKAARKKPSNGKLKELIHDGLGRN